MTAWQRPMHDRSGARSMSAFESSRLCAPVTTSIPMAYRVVIEPDLVECVPSSLRPSITKLDIWPVERKMFVTSNTFHLILVTHSSAVPRERLTTSFRLHAGTTPSGK